MKENVNFFPVICTGTPLEMRRIFPTKQRIAAEIFHSFSGDERLACIILFGSSVSMKCNQHSDTDLLVRLTDEHINNTDKNDISERLQEICDWKADILWYDRISEDERIYQSILKGVQIV